MRQEMRETPASSSLGRVGPEQIAKLLAGDRTRLGCETIEQRARLAPRSREGATRPCDFRWAEQGHPQICGHEVGRSSCRERSGHGVNSSAGFRGRVVTTFGTITLPRNGFGEV